MTSDLSDLSGRDGGRTQVFTCYGVFELTFEFEALDPQSSRSTRSLSNVSRADLGARELLGKVASRSQRCDGARRLERDPDTTGAQESRGAARRCGT